MVRTEGENMSWAIDGSRLFDVPTITDSNLLQLPVYSVTALWTQKSSRPQMHTAVMILFIYVQFWVMNSWSFCPYCKLEVKIHWSVTLSRYKNKIKIKFLATLPSTFFLGIKSPERKQYSLHYGVREPLIITQQYQN